MDPNAKEIQQAFEVKSAAQLSKKPAASYPFRIVTALPDAESKADEKLAADEANSERKIAKTSRYKDTSRLRILLAKATVRILSVQVVAIDIAMIWYVIASGKEASTTIMTAWLVSNFTEIIGVLLVITRSIFPQKSKK